MVRLVRGAVVALVAVLVAVVGALPAIGGRWRPSPSPTADRRSYGCLNPVDSYGAPRCASSPSSTLTPVCDNDVP